MGQRTLQEGSTLQDARAGSRIHASVRLRVVVTLRTLSPLQNSAERHVVARSQDGAEAACEE